MPNHSYIRPDKAITYNVVVWLRGTLPDRLNALRVTRPWTNELGAIQPALLTVGSSVRYIHSRLVQLQNQREVINKCKL